MRNKRWWSIALLACGSFLSTSTFSATSTLSFKNIFNPEGWRPFFTVTGGAAMNSDAGDSKNFPAQNDIFSYFNYTANHRTQTRFIGGGFLGAEISLYPLWSLQSGISYYQPSAFHANGTLIQGTDIDSQNQYQYEYLIQSYQLLFENKLLYHWQRYFPYITAGLGAAWNNVGSFQADIQPPFTTFSNQFQSHNNTSFSYLLGFGVDVAVTDNLRLGIGYRFTDFGAANTGTAVLAQTNTNYTLNQSHLYSNEILGQLTVVFP
ncbi:MAG: porin family protein [Pseudomonadota bacterium]